VNPLVEERGLVNALRTNSEHANKQEAGTLFSAEQQGENRFVCIGVRIANSTGSSSAS